MSKLLDSVKNDLDYREAKGVKTYGTTMDREDLNSIQWLTHLYEELLDAALYVKKISSIDTDDISDGYHTFGELYEFRKMYNAALFNEWAQSNKYNVHKSIRHHDGLRPFGDDGWFIVVAILPTGQISNHYQMKDWDLFQVPETENALFPYDFHTPKDVLLRLMHLING